MIRPISEYRYSVPRAPELAQDEYPGRCPSVRPVAE
jgi:hypothetical protein